MKYSYLLQVCVLEFTNSKLKHFQPRGRVNCSCVRGAMLYACECWPLKQTDLDRLLRNERAMLCWMCAVKPTDVINTQDLRLRLGIDDLDVAFRRKRLRWFGHVQRSTSWIGRVCSLEVGGRRSRGRPRKTWCEVLRNDLKPTDLQAEDAENRTLWRSKTKTMQHHIRELSGSVTLMDSECEVVKNDDAS